MPGDREKGLSEVELIEALGRGFGTYPPEVILGIGDDCAAMALDPENCLLWTVDTLVQGVHFDLAYTTLEQLGWKAMAVNLSDLAAMGAEPLAALLSLAWPPDQDRGLALDLGQGLARCAMEYGVAIIGGDTVASPAGLVVTITVLGRANPKQLLRRDGAQVGDGIYVTGWLGEAAAGLELLKTGLAAPPEMYAALRAAHLAPRPQLRAGRLLAREGLAHAAIDLSDGVATDLWHVCRASGMGARVTAADAVISPWVKAAAGLLNFDPQRLALSGGEDYHLLFTSPPELASRLFQAFAQAGLPTPLRLGEIITGHGVLLETGAGDVDISGAGYDHFRLDRQAEAD